jgi:DTW domain-containing protein
MIAPASTSTRNTCPRCRRPQRTCLCPWVTPTANPVAVLILQHPAEQHHAKGSVPLLRLSLTDCRVEVGASFEPDRLRSWLDAPCPGAGLSAALSAAPFIGPPACLLLYPTAAGEAAPQPGPVSHAPDGLRLVLLDGTWRQTRQMLRDHALLQQLPRCPLPAPPPSRYTIRKAQRPDQRSTLEAACLALGALDGSPARYAPLLAAFDGWVAMSRALNPLAVAAAG